MTIKKKGRTPRRQNTLTEHEMAALSGKEAADQREKTANLRQEAADQRQDTADQREDTADLRHEAANLRQEAAETLSIGISLYPDDGKDVEAVFRNADTAMFQAKKSGRNTYKMFTPEMNVRAVARQSIEQALHRALMKHEFVLHYQPKVNLETGAITGAEALLPQRLELELTESGMMQDMEQTTAILQALKKIGVQIAVDDFGTGYSSLSYLHRFPIDTLKIDQSFVQDSDGEPIVSAVIAMGTSLKQRIVAQGIETKRQLAFLQSQRCAEGQGFYFSRPVAAEQFATMLVFGQHYRRFSTLTP